MILFILSISHLTNSLCNLKLGSPRGIQSLLVFFSADVIIFDHKKLHKGIKLIMPVTQFSLTFACLPPHQSAVRSVQCVNSLRCCIICLRGTPRSNEMYFTGGCIILSGFPLTGRTKATYDQTKAPLYTFLSYIYATSAVSMWKPIPLSVSIAQSISFEEPQHFSHSLAFYTILDYVCKIRMQFLETSCWNEEQNAPGSPQKGVQFTRALLRDSTLFLNFNHQGRVIPQKRLPCSSQMMDTSPMFIPEAQRKSGSQSMAQVCLQGRAGEKQLGFFPHPLWIATSKEKCSKKHTKASIPWRQIPGIVGLVVGQGGGKSPNPVNSPVFVMQLFVVISIYKISPPLTLERSWSPTLYFDMPSPLW